MAHIKEGFKGERATIIPSFIVDELKQDPLGKELYITDIGYYPHASYHYRMRRKEEVQEFVLIYCVEGEGWFELNHRKQVVVENQFFILPEQQAPAYGSVTLRIRGVSTGCTSMVPKPLTLARGPSFPPVSCPTPTLGSKTGSLYSKRYSPHSAKDTARIVCFTPPPASSTSWAR